MKKSTILISLGVLLIASAFALQCYNLISQSRAEKESAAALAALEQSMALQENVDIAIDPAMEMPVIHVDGEDYIGTVSVPCLELELPVISEWSYPRLKKAPCRYLGSAYSNDMIIAAHNFKKHFGQLKNISLGDTVTFTDVDGNVFTYRVSDVENLPGTAVEEMEAGEWDLTLFTCTNGGRTRVTVRCTFVP